MSKSEREMEKMALLGVCRREAELGPSYKSSSKITT